MKTQALTAVAFAALSFSSVYAAEPGPTDRQRLIGAWSLVSLSDQQAGGLGVGKARTDLVGQFVFSDDGHFSVQVMYPQATEASSTANSTYAKDGYEATFGTFKVDDRTHVVTLHVEGALASALVGKDLSRKIQFLPGRRMIVRSSLASETFAVNWKHN